MSRRTKTLSASTRLQQGVSLVELMIALMIGLVLTAGIIQLFIGNKQTYRFEEAMARLQENARFAMDTLARDIRMAGNLGCTSYLNRENPQGAGALGPGLYRVALNNPNSYPWDFETAVQGHDWNGSGWTPALPGGITSLNDSDVVTLRSSEGVPVTVTGHPGGNPPGSAALLVNTPNGVNPDEILLVGDCKSAAVFQVSAGNPDQSGQIPHDTGGATAPGNATNALGRNFAGSEVMRVSSRTYFVDTGADGTPSLFRRVNLGVPEELVSGVARMRITYGVDNDANRIVDAYMTGTQVEAAGAWRQILSVRLSLLMQSDQNNITDAVQQVTFDGATITPTDRRLRQVYNTTVTLRNRTP